MGYIVKTSTIQAKRINRFINKLYDVITKLLILQQRAEDLVDKEALSLSISTLSDGILPFGDEIVLNWKMNLNFISLTKFMDVIFNATKTQDQSDIVYDRVDSSVLMPRYDDDGKYVLVDGKVSFPNIEKLDYDYSNYEILHEMYKALVLILNSTEEFYSQFIFRPKDEVDEGVIVPKTFCVIDYDTRAMDEEIDNRIYNQAQLITDEENREAVITIYQNTRDSIKNFTLTDMSPKLERYISELLYCVNGVKNYDIKFNQDLRGLVVTFIEGTTSGEYYIKQNSEEVFFPFHNKAMLDQFTEGFRALF